MVKKIELIKKNIKKWCNKIIEKVLDNEIKKTFLKLINLEFKYKILWILTLPISLLFLTINFIVIVISLCSYFCIFFFKLIETKILKKKTKKIIYKKRFKFLKNFYIILLEKILITYPKQKAFLLFYLLTKSIYKKDKTIINKEYLPEMLKSLSNRILISILLSIPYILIFCNTNLILIIKELSEYNYESKESFFNSILVNILKDLTNDYNKLILKLKIKFYKNKIIFNSNKDLINALKYKKEFYGSFYKNKKFFKVLMIKHKVYEKNFTKTHFTAISKFGDKNIYLNETSDQNLVYYEYNKELLKYKEKIHKNLYIHKGSINEKKITYFTPNIISEKENILIVNNYKNNLFIKNIKEENLNNILASFSINLNEEYLENKIIKINNLNQSVLIENENLKKTIEIYKENKNNIETEQYESVLGMQFFWEENNKLVDNLTLSEKINLCKNLNIKIESESSEINFQIFKSLINKK